VERVFPPEGPDATDTHHDAIPASLELTRSSWLITSLSPVFGEKEHAVRENDIPGSN
jgi:hypothetical protein